MNNSTKGCPFIDGQTVYVCLEPKFVYTGIFHPLGDRVHSKIDWGNIDYLDYRDRPRSVSVGSYSYINTKDPRCQIYTDLELAKEINGKLELISRISDLVYTMTKEEDNRRFMYQSFDDLEKLYITLKEM